MQDPLAPIDRTSPNRGVRRGGARADLIVIHYTAMATAEAALARLCAPEAEVSAHYLVAADGRIWRLVPEALRAWHAGTGAWGQVDDINSRSIGIELDNPGACPFAAPQMRVLELLLAGLMARHAIPPERVIGHADMTPGRKHDPGPRFDWRRLARLGLSIWPEPGHDIPPDPLRFMADARRFGYVPGDGDEAFGALLAAFRDRFRPGRSGVLDGQDMAVMAALARQWPVAGGPADH